jgi:type IX secretion system PorP/SprF family membrane protein
MNYLQAQQSAQYTLYMFNPLQNNPAFAGLSEQTRFVGSARQQWVGFAGNPASQYFSADLPLYYLKGGTALQIDNDQLGAGSMLQIGLTYAQHFDLGSDQKLSLGIAGRFSQVEIDGGKLRTPEGQYSTTSIVHNDNVLSNAVMNGKAFTANVGVHYKVRQTQIGIGVFNLLPSEIQLSSSKITQVKSYFVTASTQFQALGLNFHPSILYKTDLIQHQLDVSMVADVQSKYFFGISNRGYNEKTFDSFAIILGYQLNEKLKFCYSFDMGISKLKAFNSGSHEILLIYSLQNNLGKGVLPKTIYNPRFL